MILTMEWCYWGKSMYGGWYIEILFNSGDRASEHFNTITGLRLYAKEHNIKLKDWERLDN